MDEKVYKKYVLNNRVCPLCRKKIYSIGMTFLDGNSCCKECASDYFHKAFAFTAYKDVKRIKQIR
jgi:tRNA(Ile2) C34 agmatinyltransferase TiaS